jgi:CheY-like chemotaxis protein
VDIAPNKSADNPEAYSGQFVCLTVTDTGCGMDDATRSRIFEPFFTTKEVGKGTGMGLATVYGIIKQHKGWIEVDSEVGAGTTFRVFLPVSNASSDTIFTKLPSTEKPCCNGNETILVVEDEPSLREFVQCVLETHGYKILSAANAPDALKIWAEHSNAIRLLLTDMVMPGGMSGKELAERIRTEKADLKVVFTSGYSLNVLGEDSQLAAGFSLLQKPYNAEALAKTVRQGLDGSSHHGGLINNRWAISKAV